MASAATPSRAVGQDVVDGEAQIDRVEAERGVGLWVEVDDEDLQVLLLCCAGKPQRTVVLPTPPLRETTAMANTSSVCHCGSAAPRTLNGL